MLIQVKECHGTYIEHECYYRFQFINYNCTYWLGLKNIHCLTSRTECTELYVTLLILMA